MHSDVILDRALDVWDHLVENGGIELEGRDRGLELEILEQLGAEEPLREALENTTSTELLRVVFRIGHEYVRMLADVFAIFELARAGTVDSSMRVRFEDESGAEICDLGLESFRECQLQWRERISPMSVPVLDYAGMWSVRKALCASLCVPERSWKEIASAEVAPASPLGTWLDRYDKTGIYAELPPLAADLRRELSTVVAVVLRALALLRAEDVPRLDLVQQWRRDRFPRDEKDAFNRNTLRSAEDDYWIGQMVTLLAVASARLEGGRRFDCSPLEEVLGKYPTRVEPVSITVQELSDLLRLPTWKFRHEIYSLWVVSEVLAAGAEHSPKLFPSNGALSFGFRETVLGVFERSERFTSLVLERRTPFKSPKGDGRVEGVQPDVTLWHGEFSAERQCALVVESKHYLRSATRRFATTLDDYASAHRDAAAVLVNHGPIGDATKYLPPELAPRCSFLPGLRPSNRAARVAFASHVARCLGPRASGAAPSNSAASSSAQGTSMILDVSASCIELLKRTGVELAKLAAENDVAVLIAFDDRLRGVFPTEQLGDVLRLGGGTATDLGPGVRFATLRGAERVLVACDEDGLRSLKNRALRKIDTLARGAIHVVEVDDEA